MLFTVPARNSAELLTLLDNLEVDAALSCIDNEQLGQARAVPLYRESDRLLIAADGALAGRSSITWAEIASMPLCLLASPPWSPRQGVSAQAG